jgi:predicted nucleic acid-binding protein
MSYLVDTDWVVEYLKGRQPTTQILTSLRREGLAISLITYGEVYEGIQHGRHIERHQIGFRRLLHRIRVLPLDRPIMRRFAEIRGDLRSQGQLIGDFDTLIAATALENNLTGLTFNMRHFSRIPDLKLYRPN